LLNMLDFDLDPQSAIEAPRVVFGDILHWTPRFAPTATCLGIKVLRGPFRRRHSAVAKTPTRV
jgi:hypothetical protein